MSAFDRALVIIGAGIMGGLAIKIYINKDKKESKNIVKVVRSN